MSKYLVIGNIQRDGKLLPRDKPAEFDDAEAERLVRDGYLEAKPVAANIVNTATPEKIVGNADAATETLRTTDPAPAAPAKPKAPAKKAAKGKAE